MICRNCEEDKPVDEFGFTLGRNGVNYRRRVCSRCVRKRSSDLTLAKRKIVGSREWFRKRHIGLRVNAERRGRNFNLSFEEACVIYSQERCYFCNEKAKIRTVDRLDNERGYEPGNCVMACLPCNTLKGSLRSINKKRMLKILRKL